jgi:hypothetical protein
LTFFSMYLVSRLYFRPSIFFFVSFILNWTPCLSVLNHLIEYLASELPWDTVWITLFSIVRYYTYVLTFWLIDSSKDHFEKQPAVKLVHVRPVSVSISFFRENAKDFCVSFHHWKDREFYNPPRRPSTKEDKSVQSVSISHA